MPPLMRWQDIAPVDAVDYDLAEDLTITAPLTMDGRRCPWPWEPQQYVGAPMGQYHCGYCGEMVLAGVEHIDYRSPDIQRHTKLVASIHIDSAMENGISQVFHCACGQLWPCDYADEAATAETTSS